MLWRAKTNYKSIHVGLKKCWNWILRPDVTSWKWLAVNIKSVPSIGFISSVARIRGQSDRVWLKCIWLELHKGEFRLSRTQSNCRVQQGSLTPQTGYLFQGKAIGRCSCCSSVITVEICSQQSYWSEISKCMVVCDDFNPQIDSSEAVLWYFHALRGTDGHLWGHNCWYIYNDRVCGQVLCDFHICWRQPLSLLVGEGQCD